MAKRGVRTLTVKWSIQLPMVPNYILQAVDIPPNGEPPKVDIADIDDNGLKLIGEEWTRELLMEAAKRRELRKTLS